MRRGRLPPTSSRWRSSWTTSRSSLFDVARVVLNKPLGCVTALRDPRHPTAYALLRGAPLFDELRPVGRLDLDTSGLLFWTTDGQEIQRLTHPKRAVPRTYQAALAGPFQAAAGGFRPRRRTSPADLGRSRLCPAPTRIRAWRFRTRRASSRPSPSPAAPTTRCGGSSPRSAATCWGCAGCASATSCCRRDLPPGAFRLVSSDNRIQP